MIPKHPATVLATLPLALPLTALLLAAAGCGPSTTAGTDDVQGAAIEERPLDDATLTLSGEPAYDGAAAVECAPVGHGDEGGLRLTFSPGGLPSATVEVTVHGVHGDGAYDAELELQRDDGGAYRTSEGHGRATLDLGSELARDSATRWVSGDLEGDFEGAAGDGRVDATFQRCFYFE